MADGIDMLMRELLSAPGGRERIMQGFARKTALSPEQEAKYRADMVRLGLEKWIDDPTYDNRAAWLQGKLPDRTKDPQAHMESTFKGLGDDRMMLRVNPKTMQEDPNSPMVDTRNMQPPNPQLLNLWRAISGVMNK